MVVGVYVRPEAGPSEGKSQCVQSLERIYGPHSLTKNNKKLKLNNHCKYEWWRGGGAVNVSLETFDMQFLEIREREVLKRLAEDCIRSSLLSLKQP